MTQERIFNKLRLILLGLIVGCIIIGWFDLLPPDQTLFVRQRLFYILFAFLFVLEAQTAEPAYKFQLFLAALISIGGAFLPMPWQHVQKLGLIYGGILTTMCLQKRRTAK